MSASVVGEQKDKKRGRLKDSPDSSSKSAAASKSKRPRLKADTTHGAYPNFLLNSDVAREIFSFLDIRSLFNVTMTSKIGMRLLRHEHVVRSAMMQCGHSKTSMERLVPLIEQRCIWTPSPIRMLRLVNGRTCERCNKGRVHLVSDNYGVFFCFHGCIQDTSTKGVAFNNKWSPFLVDQPRIAKAAYSSSAYIWIRPYSDASGERVGPLISMVEMERIIRGDGSVEDLLKEKDALDPYKDAVAEISQAFKDSTEAAARRIQERKDKKSQASDKANARRKQKILVMIKMLEMELDDVPWKEIALEHEWKKSNSKEVPSFRCGLTEELLREYSSAPSKATKKKLKEVAKSLKQKFSILEEKGLHDFSFLSDSDPVERVVKEYCVENFPNYSILKKINDQTFERIKCSTTNNDLLKDLMTLVLSLKQTRLVSILAPVIVSATVATRNEELRKRAIHQATLYAGNELGGHTILHYWTRHDRNSTMTPLELYNIMMEKYPRLFQNTVDFIHAPETEAWKEQHAQELSGRLDVDTAKQRLSYLVNGVWHGPSDITELLLQRDFAAVLTLLWERATTRPGALRL